MTSPTPTTKEVIRQQPITMTINDFHQTRHSQPSQRMHWPVDAETTDRLNRVIRLDLNSSIPWWRRVVRLLRGTRLATRRSPPGNFCGRESKLL